MAAKVAIIRSDEDVMRLINEKGKFGETANDVLRRLLGLPALERVERGRPRNVPVSTVPTKRAR